MATKVQKVTYTNSAEIEKLLADVSKGEAQHYANVKRFQDFRAHQELPRLILGVPDNPGSAPHNPKYHGPRGKSVAVLAKKIKPNPTSTERIAAEQRQVEQAAQAYAAELPAANVAEAKNSWLSQIRDGFQIFGGYKDIKDSLAYYGNGFHEKMQALAKEDDYQNAIADARASKAIKEFWEMPAVQYAVNQAAVGSIRGLADAFIPQYATIFEGSPEGWTDKARGLGKDLISKAVVDMLTGGQGASEPKTARNARGIEYYSKIKPAFESDDVPERVYVKRKKNN